MTWANLTEKGSYLVTFSAAVPLVSCITWARLPVAGSFERVFHLNPISAYAFLTSGFTLIASVSSLK